MYDRICGACDYRMIDSWEPVHAPRTPCPKCGGTTARAWLTKPSNVVGDECDVLVKHGLCEADGTPRRFTSKAEMQRVAKEKGLTQYVEHRGTRDGDRSPHTSRWV